MSGYIEQEETQEATTTSSETKATTEASENAERWRWLTVGWANMTFSEKMSLFYPYTFITDPNMNAYQDHSNNIDRINDLINESIISKAYELCRNVERVSFDPDRRGIPNVLVVFKPIDTDQIPDATIKSEVVVWGTTYGFIKSS